jgi:hypothetical protein
MEGVAERKGVLLLLEVMEVVRQVEVQVEGVLHLRLVVQGE